MSRRDGCWTSSGSAKRDPDLLPHSLDILAQEGVEHERDPAGGRSLAAGRQGRAVDRDIGRDVLHGRSALGIYPPMRRHPQIPLSPQLAIDGGLAHSAMSKDEAIGLQGVQNGH